MSRTFDVVCLGGGVADEDIAAELRGSGLTLAIVARRIRGLEAKADHRAIPRVTYTDAEIASVGLSKAAARAQGIDVTVASTDPAETARGYIHDFRGGLLKLVGDRRSGAVIGATLVTPRAGEIVGELVLAIKLRTPSKPSLTSSVLFPRSTACSGPAWASSPARSRDTSPREPDHPPGK